MFDISSLIAVPVEPQPRPFPPLPVELIRCIFEHAAYLDGDTGHVFLLVSSAVRRWIHPIVYETIEIFGLLRMVNFAAIFAGQTLLATSVRNLLLSFFPQILTLCRGVRRLAFNYIRGIPSLDGPQPYELTIRRGIRGITLKSPPFQGVTHLHCRWEQLTPCFLKKLAMTRLTHLCFTHHLDFSDSACEETVEYLLQAPRLQLLIVEVAFQEWHTCQDPSVRRVLANNIDERLFLRLSMYDTVRPYDAQRIFSGHRAHISVWDVTSDLDWRTQAWTSDAILNAYRN
ncbi:hypothetical protein JB92DRAFT_3030845 [Gautieria morchelliformis]|nr:hypothetical protein JB92DRAFT_3030845 [Gautieria morchelliformis]